MKNTIFLKLITILILSLVFISCLEIETEIAIKEDQSGTWFLKYRIMQEAAFITPGNELSGYNYFPLDETEFRRRVDGISGLEIISLSLEETIFYKQITSEMKFDTTNAIQFFFNTFSENPLISIDHTEKGVFELDIFNPFPGADNKETFDLFSGLYSNKSIEITVILPGLVTESNKGFLSENTQEAIISLTVMETLNITDSYKWIVNYE